MVAVVGIGAVALSRSAIRSTTAARDWSECGVAAQSAVECAIANMNADASWRSDLKSGKAYGPIAIGRARANITIIDEIDGDLANDQTQPARIYGVATIGGATRCYSALAAPASTTGYDVLRCAVACNGTMTVSANAAATVGPLSSNGTINNSATLTADLECNALSSSGFVLGYVQTGVAAKTMPPNTAWTTLSAVATPLTYSSTFDRQVLTPGLNTINGTVNPSGVYSVSVPLLSTLTIKRSRLQATLLVTLGATASLVVVNDNLWDPGSSSQPALIVQGALLSSVSLGGSTTTTVLSEATNSANYNPAGAPYNAITDADTADTYPCELHGLYHIISNIPVTIASNLHLTGCIVAGGNVTISTTAQLTATPSLVSSPPTGYADPSNTKMLISPGTFRWEVSSANP